MSSMRCLDVWRMIPARLAVRSGHRVLRDRDSVLRMVEVSESKFSHFRIDPHFEVSG